MEEQAKSLQQQLKEQKEVQVSAYLFSIAVVVLYAGYLGHLLLTYNHAV